MMTNARDNSIRLIKMMDNTDWHNKRAQRHIQSIQLTDNGDAEAVRDIRAQNALADARQAHALSSRDVAAAQIDNTNNRCD